MDTRKSMADTEQMWRHNVKLIFQAIQFNGRNILMESSSKILESKSTIFP